MKNSVTLEFPGSITYLAGYKYGQDVYAEQILNRVDLNEQFRLVFPENIKGVAASFVQGLFANIVKQIGLKNTEDRLCVTSSQDDLYSSIIKRLQ